MPYVSSFERIGREEGIQQGQQEKAKNLIRSLLTMRFGIIDEELAAVIDPLSQESDDEVVRVVLSSTREQLLARFGRATLH